MSDDPASPCTLVCMIDPASGWCFGCRRTLDEIARWGSASTAEKRAILAAVAQREGSAGPPPQTDQRP